MGPADAGVSNFVSLCRIGLAFAFLFLFRNSTGALLVAAAAIAAIAQITDHLDGYLVRRLGEPSAWGWMCDSLADRAFYLAAILSFEREFALNEFVVWCFTLREMALYAVGAVSPTFKAAYQGLRQSSLVHAAIVRFSIVFGCVIPFAVDGGLPPDFLRHALSAMITVATAIGYFNLWTLLRRLR